MRRHIVLLSAFLTVLAAVTVSLVSPASAHERRAVAGKYTFVVGFLEEPVYLEQPNAVSLTVTNSQTNEPVEGVEKALKVDITAGGQTRTADLSARFGQRGAYVANVVPTKGGPWTFRFYGTFEGTAIDEKFESGPGRFNEPQAVTELQFPVKLPSIADLSERSSQPATGATPVPARSTSPDVQRALDRADSARTLGIGGLVVGLLGLVVAGVALATRRGGTDRSAGGGTGRNEPV